MARSQPKISDHRDHFHAQEKINITKSFECLQSVDEVVVVDSGSTDGTVELARAVRPNVRPLRHEFKDFCDQGTRCLTALAPGINGNHIFDADEYFAPALLNEISEFTSRPRQVRWWLCSRKELYSRSLAETLDDVSVLPVSFAQARESTLSEGSAWPAEAC